MNYELRIKKSRNRACPAKLAERSRGYTIIETMIATSLFLIIVTIGMGSLLNANSIHKKSQNTRSIIDNLNFVMEDMSRNLRTGYNYQCFNSIQPLSRDLLGIPRSCSGGGWALAFEYASGDITTYGDQWVYYVDDGKIFRSTNGLSSNAIQLTPDEIIINSLSSFKVEGAEPPSTGNNQQPFVTIKLVGEINSNGVVSPFSLQTSVSQRKLDI